MFCFNCGKQLPEEAKFCAYCGINLSQLKNDIDDVQDAVTIEETSKNDEDIAKVIVPQNVSREISPKTPSDEFAWAERYERGLDGFERNLRKAFDLYVKAAKSGYTEAQFRLARAYENGELNLKENNEKAYDWYEQAANNGHIEAMFVLALRTGNCTLNRDEILFCINLNCNEIKYSYLLVTILTGHLLVLEDSSGVNNAH